MGGGEAGAGGGDVTVPPLVPAYPHVHLRMDWSDEGRRRTGAGSCRVGACQAKRAELAADLQMAQNALRAYMDTVGAQVVGQVRAAEQQVAAMQREVDACKCEAAKSAEREVCYRRVADELGRASMAQTAEVADLKGQVAELSALLAEREREARGVEERAEAERKRHQREEARLARSHEKMEREMQRQHFEADVAAGQRAFELQQRVEAAEGDAASALEAAERARDEAIVEGAHAADAAADAVQSQCDWTQHLLEKRMLRAQQKAAALRDTPHVPADRTPEQWAELSADAERSAGRRERQALTAFLKSHTWRTSDLAQVLAELDMLDDVFDSQQGTATYMTRVRTLLSEMEEREYGVRFALFLHFEMQLTLDKIHRIMQAACKDFNPSSNRYAAKVLFYDRYKRQLPIKVTRIVPPRHKIQAVVKQIYEQLGTEIAEDGRIAFVPVVSIIQSLLSQDAGKYSMPPRSEFIGGKLKLPIVISWDATGFGNQQFNTGAINNPFTPESAQQLRIFGLGNCADSREGTVRLFGPNLDTLNEWIAADQADECISIQCPSCESDDDGESGGVGSVEISPEVFIVTDMSALRHCEHLSCSGWCCCSHDDALRKVPRRPSTDAELDELMKICVSPTAVQRHVRSHNTVPGEQLPRPCDAAGCTFAHNRATAAAEQAAMLAKEEELVAVTTKKGKRAFADWRMEHARLHGNIQPGKHGAPMLRHDLDKQLLDVLHLAELNCNKVIWKHGILQNASDDAREQISDQLKQLNHPLVTRRKDDNRVQAQKWFSGEAWATFADGHKGSPGGPKAIAQLVFIIAQDLQRRGVDSGAAAAAAATPTVVAAATPGAAAAAGGARGRGSGRGRAAGGGGRGRGRAAFVAAAAAQTPCTPATVAAVRVADSAAAERETTAIERAADPEDLAIIRELFGSRAQTLINALLSFDAYFQWYYPLKRRMPFRAPLQQRRERALDNCRRAIDMQEIVERLSIQHHKSFVFHGAVYKLTRDILRVGDLWSVCLSALELQNASTKRTATAGGARRLTVATSGLTRDGRAAEVCDAGPVQPDRHQGLLHDDGALHAAKAARPQLPPEG